MVDSQKFQRIFSRKLGSSRKYIADEYSSSLEALDLLCDLNGSELLTIFGYQSFSNTDNERRGPESDINVHRDLVYSGCSETAGLEMSDRDQDYSNIRYIWGELVAKSMGVEPTNLALGGLGVDIIVSDLISHLSIYKAKTVLVLFPGLHNRISAISSPKVLVNRRSKGDDAGDGIVRFGGVGESITKIAKAPYDPEEVLSQGVPLLANLRAIKYLEIFCKLSGIELIYSTWEPLSDSILSSANVAALECGVEKPFPNYISVSSLINRDFYPEPSDCHIDEENHPFWNLSRNEHMGIHSNIHVAEKFIEELTKRRDTATV